MTSTTMEWLTVNEAATYLKVARTTIYRLVRQKKLPLYRLGDRLVRLRREDLDALAQPQRTESPTTEDSAWAMLSHQAFAEDWNSEEDAIYDHWRDIYGLRQR